MSLPITLTHQELTPDRECVAFAGTSRIAQGPLSLVLPAAKAAADRSDSGPVLLFDSKTSQRIEIDYRGSLEETLARLSFSEPIARNDMEIETPESRGPGRPKLGVVAREVTLLPKHWDWLNSQPGGASVALRRLVAEARRANEAKDRQRESQEATYRFISVLAGDLDCFEEASRALFAGDLEKFNEMTAGWPKDVGDHARALARQDSES